MAKRTLELSGEQKTSKETAIDKGSSIDVQLSKQVGKLQQCWQIHFYSGLRQIALCALLSRVPLYSHHRRRRRVLLLLSHLLYPLLLLFLHLLLLLTYQLHVSLTSCS